MSRWDDLDAGIAQLEEGVRSLPPPFIPTPRDASQDERGGEDRRPGAGSVKPLWRRWLAWTGIVTLLVGLPWLIGVCAAGPLLLLVADDEPTRLPTRVEAVEAVAAPQWIKDALRRDLED